MTEPVDLPASICHAQYLFPGRQRIDPGNHHARANGGFFVLRISLNVTFSTPFARFNYIVRVRHDGRPGTIPSGRLEAAGMSYHYKVR
jgi:hypothetical protein